MLSTTCMHSFPSLPFFFSQTHFPPLGVHDLLAQPIIFDFAEKTHDLPNETHTHGKQSQTCFITFNKKKIRIHRVKYLTNAALLRALAN